MCQSHTPCLAMVLSKLFSLILSSMLGANKGLDIPFMTFAQDSRIALSSHGDYFTHFRICANEVCVKGGGQLLPDVRCCVFLRLELCKMFALSFEMSFSLLADYRCVGVLV